MLVLLFNSILLASRFLVSSEEVKAVKKAEWSPGWKAYEVERIIKNEWSLEEIKRIGAKFNQTITSPWHAALPFPQNDSRYYVHASDLADMWLRDTACLLHPYLLFLWSATRKEAPVSVVRGARRVVEGAAVTMAELFAADSECSIWSELLVVAFLDGKKPICPKRMWPTSGVIGFELDEPLYLVRLIWHLHKAYPSSQVLVPDGRMHRFAVNLLEVMQRKQDRCGLIATKERPSDDPTVYPLHIPDNFFAATCLGHLQEIAIDAWKDFDLARRAQSMQTSILSGIAEHASRDHPTFGRVYCYEVACDGACLYRDDANLPSLISIPYLDEGRHLYDPDTYTRTRRMVLSVEGNALFFQGKYASGIGSESARTGKKIWTMGLISRALTASTPTELSNLLRIILNTSQGYGLVEAFDPSQPASFSRLWFDWPNALYTELILRCCSHFLDFEDLSPHTALPLTVLQNRPDLSDKHKTNDSEWQLCSIKSAECHLPTNSSGSVCLRYGNGWDGELILHPDDSHYNRARRAPGHGRWTTHLVDQKSFPVNCRDTLANPAPKLPKSCWFSFRLEDCPDAPPIDLSIPRHSSLHPRTRYGQHHRNVSSRRGVARHHQYPYPSRVVTKVQ